MFSRSYFPLLCQSVICTCHVTTTSSLANAASRALVCLPVYSKTLKIYSWRFSQPLRHFSLFDYIIWVTDPLCSIYRLDVMTQSMQLGLLKCRLNQSSETLLSILLWFLKSFFFSIRLFYINLFHICLRNITQEFSFFL